MATLDGLVLHGVNHLQARHDLAGGKDADLEFVVGDAGDALGEVLARAIDRVERLGEARGEPPLHFRHGLRDGRCGERGARGDCGTADTGGAQKLTTLHDSITP